MAEIIEFKAKKDKNHKTKKFTLVDLLKETQYKMDCLSQEPSSAKRALLIEEISDNLGLKKGDFPN
ncbi:MAG: hypothetical protein AB7D28_03875 [Candidatus Berkiella sp.]